MKRWRIIDTSWLLATAASIAQTTIQFTAVHALPANQVKLAWSSDTHRWYIIESGLDLVRSFDDFDVGLPELAASPEKNTHTVRVEDSTCRFYRIVATLPVGPYDSTHTNGGTVGDDTQIQIGTASADMIVQSGVGGSDTQYASGSGSNDWMEQRGGIGMDSQHALGGSGDDSLCQDGGKGNDTIYADGDDGDDWIIQKGGEDGDQLGVFGDMGNDSIWQNGGEGGDAIRVDGGYDDDTVHMLGGDGNDTLSYTVSEGSDTAMIDGGNDTDVLNVHYAIIHTFAIRLPDGTDLFAVGVPDTIITVMGLEAIYTVDPEGTTNWLGTAR